MSKDPTLVHRKSPLKMSETRAQREGQTTGNTNKRVRAFPQQVALEGNPRPLKRKRQETSPRHERDSTPGDRGMKEASLAPGTPKRSRWSRRRQTLEQGHREVPQGMTQPTMSGRLGPLAGLRRSRAPRQPSPGRVGNGKGTPTDIRTLVEETEPPDRE